MDLACTGLGGLAVTVHSSNGLGAVWCLLLGLRNPIGEQGGEGDPVASRGLGELCTPGSAEWMKLYIRVCMCVLPPSLNSMLWGFSHAGGKSLALSAGGTRDPVTAEMSGELLWELWSPGGSKP